MRSVESFGLPSGQRRAIASLAVVLVGGLTALGLFLLLNDQAVDGDVAFVDRYLYPAIFIGAALLCLARARLVSRERAAWLCIGLYLLTWGLAEVYWGWVLTGDPNAPYPSPADVFYIGSYPFAFAGIALLIRARVRQFPASRWLDGLIAALTAGAFWSALVLPEVISSGGGDLLADAVTIAYPVMDMLLAAFLLGLIVLVGWQLDRTWTLVVISLGLTVAADTLFASYDAVVYPDWIDLLWPLAAVLLAFAAWLTPHRAEGVGVRGWRAIATPAVLALGAQGILVYGYAHEENLVAPALAVAALTAVAIRLAITYYENERLLVRAQTDALTGLGNRGKLMLDLEDEIRHAGSAGRSMLVAFDLDGFKGYNDAFGHPAGDVLLRRLSVRLDHAVSERGAAYRIGGDEFCVLIQCPPEQVLSAVGRCAAALRDSGEGFDVGSSYGSVVLGEEARSSAAALQIADARMYERKANARSSARNQAKDVLMRTLRERKPELGDHVDAVAKLAAVIGRRLGLDSEEVDVIARAAELHDIGKIAIPDSVLEKPDELDESETNFIQDHTVMGERILSAAPALRPVAQLVRSSHERWDGSGYPDGLAGEEIPIGSRIIFVCDAFGAMTSDRPYSAASSTVEALKEIRRCAGSQFDPRVVEAFCAEAEARFGPGFESGLAPERRA